MAAFNVTATGVAWIGRWSDATVRNFIADNTEVWFRVYGDSLKVWYQASGTSPIRINIDNAGWTTPAGGTFVSSGPTVLSGELMPGASDAFHDVKIRVADGYATFGFKILISGGIIVTSTAGTASIEAHSEFGQVERLRDSYAVLYWNETFGDAIAGSSKFVSPIFPGSRNTLATTPCRNAYAEFNVNSATTNLSVFAKQGSPSFPRETTFSIWVDDQLISQQELASNSLSQFGTNGPYTIPGSGTRKVRVSNLTSLDAVVVNGAFVATAVNQPTTRILWVGDSVTEANQATGEPGTSLGWDHVSNILIGGYKHYNRGLAGDTAGAFNSNSRVTKDVSPMSPNLVVFNLSINDASAFQSSPAATRAIYVTALQSILDNTTADVIAVAQLPYASANRSFAVTGIQGAVTDLSAYGSRISYYSSDGWTSSNNDASHPRDLGKVQAVGGGAASVGIAAQPADTATITINGTVFEFDNNASVSGGNIPVTIAASLVLTIANLITAVNAQSAAYRTLATIVLPSDTSNQGVALRGVTSLSVSGANLTAYYSAVGWYDMLYAWLNAAAQNNRTMSLLGVG